MSTLQGRKALVTGAGIGIGEGIARELARQGASVALHYGSSGAGAHAAMAEITAAGGEAVALQGDLRFVGDCERVVAEAVEALGGLDILVNNAGVFVAARFEETSPADLERLWNINVRAPIVAIQAAVKHMREGGRIITIGSTLGDRVGFPGVTLYSMTKAAVVGLTRGLARDLGRRGICVNVVAPGPIDTDMNPADADGSAAQAASTALNRYGETTDIAAMVSHLAGESGRYITGATFLVDGGYAA